jgi:hypothetical protein
MTRSAQHARPYINNTHFEFLRPALERWVDCIDRFNQLQGDADAPYWHGSAANVGMLAAAAWQGELVALQQYQSKKQRDEGEREGRCDLSISNAEASVHLHAGQRWPRIARLDLASALQETAAQARHIGYASQLKAGALFVTPGKPASTPAPKSCRTWSTTCRSTPPAPSLGTSPMPIASCTTSWGSTSRRGVAAQTGLMPSVGEKRSASSAFPKRTV